MVPSKRENKDYGPERFGGSIILREAYQLPNGDLATKFPAEAIWATRSPLRVNLTEAENARRYQTGKYCLMPRELLVVLILKICLIIVGLLWRLSR